LIYKTAHASTKASRDSQAFKRCSVRLYLQLFVGGIVFYLRYLCLFACSGVQHILCCVFCLVFLRLVYIMLPVSLYCRFIIEDPGGSMS